ncbi:MAG TPA: hypothetical protein VJQ52_18720 [Steroidobacteraceae bacterium]|nr:hypothetical protein [Steroidobacteraceae bacterium]
MDQLTFANTASLLKANGYAPAPIGDGGKPLGPFAVLQIAYAKYTTNDDLPAAVLTSVPAARNAQDPVQDYRSTWLATLTMNVRDELVKDVDRIVAKYIGKGARCPVRLADDGSTLRVFQLSGDQFSTIATYDHALARVESAAGFVPVNGTWADGISLVDVMRNELPELDHERAKQLIGELNALLDAHAPPVAPPALYVAPPILKPGQSLRYGNTRAMDVLRGNGLQPLPVRWGQQQVEKDGYSDFMGNWHYNVSLDDHGVGINLRGFALVEQMGSTFRDDVDAAIRAMGPCLVRTVRGEQIPPNVGYLFRCYGGGGDEFVSTPTVGVQVRRTGLLELSGADTYGREFQWSRDLLTVRANELPALESHDTRRLRDALESLPSIVDYRRKRA